MIPIYVDMDGVMVNLTKGFCGIFNVPLPQGNVCYRTWCHEQTGLPLEDFVSRLEAHPEMWQNLEPVTALPALLQVLDLYAPGWQILTCALPQPGCWSGKMLWVKRHLSEVMIKRLILVHENKARFAAPGAMLIDDDIGNCQEWQRAGGSAFHWMDYVDGLQYQELVAGQLKHLEKFLRGIV